MALSNVRTTNARDLLDLHISVSSGTISKMIVHGQIAALIFGNFSRWKGADVLLGTC
jgi:hypothetical protein